MRISVMVLGLSAVAYADEVLLQSGGRLLGIAREEGDSVIVETAHGMVTVPRDQVLSIDRTKRSLIEDYKARLAATDSKSAPALWALSVWARDNGLPRQSRELMQKVIELDPDHEFARRALGYIFFQGKWMTYDEMMLAKGFVKHKGKWMTESERELAVKAEAEAQARKAEEDKRREDAKRKKEEEAKKTREEPRSRLTPPPGDEVPSLSLGQGQYGLPTYNSGGYFQGFVPGYSYLVPGYNYFPGYAMPGYSYYYGSSTWPFYSPWWAPAPRR